MGFGPEERKKRRKEEGKKERKIERRKGKRIRRKAGWFYTLVPVGRRIIDWRFIVQLP